MVVRTFARINVRPLWLYATAKQKTRIVSPACETNMTNMHKHHVRLHLVGAYMLILAILVGLHMKMTGKDLQMCILIHIHGS